MITSSESSIHLKHFDYPSHLIFVRNIWLFVEPLASMDSQSIAGMACAECTEYVIHSLLHARPRVTSKRCLPMAPCVESWVPPGPRLGWPRLGDALEGVTTARRATLGESSPPQARNAAKRCNMRTCWVWMLTCRGAAWIRASVPGFRLYQEETMPEVI